MKRLFLLWLCLNIGTDLLFAQEKRYDIALSGGFYQAPDYKRAQNKYCLALDFDYHLTKRWTISSGFLSGKFAYYEDYRNNTTGYGDPYRNADGYESHTYLIGSYTLTHDHKFTLQVGTGVGLFTQRLKYPLQLPSSYGTPGLPGGSIITAEESVSKLEFPIKIEGFYMVSARVGLGAKAGAFLQGNQPLSSTYFGPQVRVRL